MKKRCIFCQKVSDVEDSETDCPQCGNTNKLTPFVTAPKGFMRGKFEPFKSTVDGTIIDGHRALQEHNKRNGVVSMAAGYNTEQLQKADFKKPTTKLDRQQLANDLGESILKVQNGYKPEVHYDD